VLWGLLLFAFIAGFRRDGPDYLAIMAAESRAVGLLAACGGGRFSWLLASALAQHRARPVSRFGWWLLQSAVIVAGLG
jgi:glycine/D-amino acid oxidase-like deaminating enzyme